MKHFFYTTDKEININKGKCADIIYHAIEVEEDDVFKAEDMAIAYAKVIGKSLTGGRFSGDHAVGCDHVIYKCPDDIVPEEKPYDIVGFIMDFECGDVSEDEIVKNFQKMIDSGIVWTLQGNYGRIARSLISEGFCTEAK